MAKAVTKSAKGPKKPAAKKPAAKKPAVKKPAVKKPVAKKPAAKSAKGSKKPNVTSVSKKPAPKKPAAKKPAPTQPTAKQPAPKKPAPKQPVARVAAEPATIDAFRPFVLLGPSEASTGWQLLLADSASPIEVFEPEGRSGNGYAWDSVARVAIRAFPEHADAIEFDSESGTFVAMSEQKAPLIALGAALLRLLENPAELRTVIRSVPEEDWDD
jgi:hypothetical protein